MLFPARDLWRKELTQLRKGQLTQTLRRLFGEIGEHHGNMVAGVAVACAGNDHSITMNPRTVML